MSTSIIFLLQLYNKNAVFKYDYTVKKDTTIIFLEIAASNIKGLRAVLLATKKVT
ncbi:hypothetical protein SAMN05216524_103535 [Mucilaginibacter sp. OK098]|nr:hypothetical protein SAMN05216524_103535 [Mucilaginibacter sp. OK098]